MLDHSVWQSLRADEAFVDEGEPDPKELYPLLVARHHGMPTDISDWSSSPYVAAFFAFCEAFVARQGETAAIWAIDLQVIEKEDGSEALRHIKSPIVYSTVPRAVNQCAVALQHLDPAIPLEMDSRVSSFLRKIVVPLDQAPRFMDILSYMTINHRFLLSDLSAAAKAAIWTVRLRKEA